MLDGFWSGSKVLPLFLIQQFGFVYKTVSFTSIDAHRAEQKYVFQIIDDERYFKTK